MKKISITLVCTLALALTIIGCGKVVLDYGAVEKLSADQALLKVNYVSAYADNRSVFFKINGQRVSNLLTGRTPFPGGGYNTGGANNSNLLIINSGTVNFSVIQPHKIDNGLDSVVLYSTAFQAEAGKNYNLHITDTAATTKNVLTQQDLTLPDSSVVRYKFINLMPNVSSIDLYYGATSATAADQSTDSLVMGNVNYLQMSDSFTLKAGVLKTWKIRIAGAPKTAATVLASYSSTSVVANQRVFTAFACGYSGKATPAQKPYISFFLVR
ncbi:MAG: DUF4397 domain-containing protein [Candidatus Pedobacter colombiensis]|uniref:DUF4397 domain-containing protein n=1 Tax=Candidatus Pedobacter colombiensis TaxID=3121371 RepID=A0AAJ5WDD5_9SPHI|nr:DUF4397 domain-containing protein [Pedobacter sp.]WEK21389.1 MAG: DUF4397 domain-containing protein [Pedobacter sp.]